MEVFFRYGKMLIKKRKTKHIMVVNNHIMFQYFWALSIKFPDFIFAFRNLGCKYDMIF